MRKTCPNDDFPSQVQIFAKYSRVRGRIKLKMSAGVERSRKARALDVIRGKQPSSVRGHRVYVCKFYIRIWYNMIICSTKRMNCTLETTKYSCPSCKQRGIVRVRYDRIRNASQDWNPYISSVQFVYAIIARVRKRNRNTRRYLVFVIETQNRIVRKKCELEGSEKKKKKNNPRGSIFNSFV